MPAHVAERGCSGAQARLGLASGLGLTMRMCGFEPKSGIVAAAASDAMASGTAEQLAARITTALACSGSGPGGSGVWGR